MLRLCLSVVLVLLILGSVAYKEAGAESDEPSQYRLTVLSMPNVLYIEGSGLYQVGSTATTGKAPDQFRGYKFVGWQVDGQWYVGNPVTIRMDRDHKAVAVYDQIRENNQEEVKVKVDIFPKKSGMIVDGILYLPSELPLEFDWALGSTHTVAVSDLKVNEGSGTRYIFDKWIDLSKDPSRTVTVDKDMTIRALFKVQHYLKIISEYGEVQGKGWYDEDQTVEFSVSPTTIIDENANGHRYVFARWDNGDYRNSPNNSITIEGPTLVRAEWKDQYYLKLLSSVPEMKIAGSGWYDKGEQVPLVSAEEADSSTNAGYVFDRWVNAGKKAVMINNAESTSASLTMEDAYMVMAEYKESYYVNVVTPYGTSMGSGLYKEGTFADISVSSREIEIEMNKVKAVFNGWDVGGAETASSEQNAQNIKVKVNGPLTIAAKWKMQYYLDVISSQGSVSGSGWYDLGNVAYVNVKAPSTPPGLWVRYIFDGWSGDYQGKSMDGKVIMNKQKTVKADWRDDYSPALMNSGIIAGVGAGSTLMYRRTRKNGHNHSQENGNNSQVHNTASSVSMKEGFGLDSIIEHLKEAKMAILRKQVAEELSKLEPENEVAKAELQEVKQDKPEDKLEEKIEEKIETKAEQKPSKRKQKIKERKRRIRRAGKKKQSKQRRARKEQRRARKITRKKIRRVKR